MKTTPYNSRRPQTAQSAKSSVAAEAALEEPIRPYCETSAPGAMNRVSTETDQGFNQIIKQHRAPAITSFDLRHE